MEKVGIDINYASKCIKNGNLVVFPTETVYGIGANALDEKAVSKIFKAKNRPADNPLIVHVNSIEMAESIVENIGEIERKIMNKFWPGPISIIMNKKENIPVNVSAGLDTVSVRMPDNKLALKLIEESNCPIAAPSANVSGKPSGTCIEDIYDELKENVDYFIDDGISNIGIESTVVKVENNKIIILRPGKITKEQLQTICKNVEIDKNCFAKPEKNEKVLSPGMKHKHYAPKTECILFKINKKENINNIINENKDKNIAFMVMEGVYQNIPENVKVINLGNTMDDVSKNIFKELRNLDKDNIDKCYIQAVEEKGLGIGIMNRLIRACDYNIIEL